MGCLLLILFGVLTFTVSPWWLLAAFAALTDDASVVIFAVAIVLAITVSPWWLLLWLLLLLF